ncbi:MAG: nucleotidyltransferase domain-containing protein [Clostridia bacterium]|nr:nucleotidyltransferase domain-containing protein [Clostridia bacterium]
MCTQEKLNLILEEFAKQIKIIFSNRLNEVILFGSYARGDFDSESDVDIAILADIAKEEESAYARQLIRIMGDIYEKFDYCVVLSPIVISYSFYLEWKDTLPFYKNVAGEGVRIVA